MRKLFIIGLCISSLIGWASARSPLGGDGRPPAVALKTNALYWATATPNLGVEFRLAPRWSLEAEVGLNPFTGKEDDGSYGKSIKHFRVHPELRYWFCETFYGHFLGVHVPYGYNWVVGKHWNIEATIGVGYLYLESDKYPCENCGTRIENTRKHYFGPTQAAVSAIYLF